MADVLQKSKVADIVSQHMRHNPMAQQRTAAAPLGNVVELITFIKSTDADRDLGVMGTVKSTKKLIIPEPYINAVNVTMVMKSNGAYQLSDLKMTVSRDSLTNDEAADSHSEFDVNGVRYQIQAYTPGPSAWEFVIRRKALEPSTP